MNRKELIHPKESFCEPLLEGSVGVWFGEMVELIQNTAGRVPGLTRCLLVPPSGRHLDLHQLQLQHPPLTTCFLYHQFRFSTCTHSAPHTSGTLWAAQRSSGQSYTTSQLAILIGNHKSACRYFARPGHTTSGETFNTFVIPQHTEQNGLFHWDELFKESASTCIKTKL